MGLLYNAGYRLGTPAPAALDGVVVHTCSADAERSLEELNGVRQLLIDPNVYVWGLDPATASRTCAYTATYPWVPIDVPSVDEYERRRRDWINDGVTPVIEESWPPIAPDDLHELVRKCLDWQASHGATVLIAPAPLIGQVHGGMEEYGQWLAAAGAAAPSFSQPVLMTVAFSEVCFPAILEGLLDSLTTARDIAGCYVVLETAHTSPYVATRALADALLEICYHLGHIRGHQVVVNFADCFGLLCLAAGATDMVAGYGVKHRRFSLSDYSDGGGGPYPRFFSVRTFCRYLASDDMTRIRDEQMLEEFLSDRTPACDSLLTALQNGATADAALGWEQRRNNTVAAKDHMVQRLRIAVDTLASAGSISERVAWTRRQLLQADSLNALLRETFADEPLDEDGSHVRVWRQAFAQFTERYGL